MRCHAPFQDTLPPPKMTTHLARNYCECLRATAQENTSHIHLRAPPGLVVGYLYLWRHGFWGILSKDRKKVGLVGDQKVCGASTAFNSCSQLSRHQGMWVTYSRLLWQRACNKKPPSQQPASFPNTHGLGQLTCSTQHVDSTRTLNVDPCSVSSNRAPKPHIATQIKKPCADPGPLSEQPSLSSSSVTMGKRAILRPIGLRGATGVWREGQVRTLRSEALGKIWRLFQTQLQWLKRSLNRTRFLWHD